MVGRQTAMVVLFVKDGSPDVAFPHPLFPRVRPCDSPHPRRMPNTERMDELEINGPHRPDFASAIAALCAALRNRGVDQY